MSASHLLGLGATNANLEKSDNAGFYFETDSYEACNEFCAFDIFLKILNRCALISDCLFIRESIRFFTVRPYLAHV